MARAPVNPHAFEEIQLDEGKEQKSKDRLNEYLTDTRHRVDTLVKSIFILSGGALTISIGIFLRPESPPINESQMAYLQGSWILIFCSLAASTCVLFVMICQGYILGERWRRAIEEGKYEIKSTPGIKFSKGLAWTIGIFAFLCFLSGLAALAWVAITSIEATPSMPYQTTIKEYTLNPTTINNWYTACHV